MAFVVEIYAVTTRTPFAVYESRSTRPLPHAGFVTIAALSVARSIMLAVMLGLTTIQ